MRSPQYSKCGMADYANQLLALVHQDQSLIEQGRRERRKVRAQAAAERMLRYFVPGRPEHWYHGEVKAILACNRRDRTCVEARVIDIYEREMSREEAQ